MPGSAMLQLVAKNEEDLYMIMRPEITFFKILYRRHTPFFVESKRQNFKQNPNYGDVGSCLLTKLGDLLHDAMLFISLPPLDFSKEKKQVAWARNIAYALINEITLEFGGKIIDKRYGDWLFIWNDLTQHKKIDKIVGNIPELYEFTEKKEGADIYLPFDFDFCKYSVNSLPLVSMTSIDIKINVQFRKLEEVIIVGPTHKIQIHENIFPFSKGEYIKQVNNNIPIYGLVTGYDFLNNNLEYVKIVNSLAPIKNFTKIDYVYESSYNKKNIIINPITEKYCTPIGVETTEQINLNLVPKLSDAYLYVDYIYLGSDERLRFAKTNNEYLTYVLQTNLVKNLVDNASYKMKLDMTGPIEEIILVPQMDGYVGKGTINDRYNFTDSPIRYKDGKLYGKDIIKELSFDVAGIPFFSVADSKYFSELLPYQVHSKTATNGVYITKYCLNAEYNQPNGSYNATMYDINFLLKFNSIVNSFSGCRLTAYSRSINLARMFAGYAALSFS